LQLRQRLRESDLKKRKLSDKESMKKEDKLKKQLSKRN
jgi:hypothetical protein